MPKVREQDFKKHCSLQCTAQKQVYFDMFDFSNSRRLIWNRVKKRHVYHYIFLKVRKSRTLEGGHVLSF